MKGLVFGKGWLGNRIADHFDCRMSDNDILDCETVGAELLDFRPDVVFNAAGKCGSPNIDWCESSETHKRLTMYVNAYAPVVLYHMVEGVAKKLKQPMLLVHLSSGCLWEWGEDVTEDTEADPPSYYSLTKIEGERRLPTEKCLVIRLRMPLSSEPHPRNLITKVSRYGNVLDTQNSITVIEDMLPALEKLISQGARGVYNVVNPGSMSPAELMLSYKETVDSEHTFDVATVESLKSSGLITAGRSNVTLDTAKLEAMGIKLPPVVERVREILREYKERLCEGNGSKAPDNAEAD
jgi:dTDP-4-dehydrorhamnose reductase